MYYELTDHFVVASPLDKTWAFFSDAGNLAAITPPWLAFTVQTPSPIHMGDGTRLDYTIRWMGLPIRWRTRIVEWSPPRQFADLQTRGPYTLWLHQHTFDPVEDGVACRDRVIYKLPVPGVAPLVHWLTVRKQLREIFRFRRTVIAERLGWRRALQEDVEIRRLD